MGEIHSLGVAMIFSRSPGVPQDWRTLAVQRDVLVAAHTLTSLARLEDIVPLFESDPRIQVRYTQVPDALGNDVDQWLRQRRVSVVPWPVERRFDLVIGASLHRLGDIPANRKMAVPHGAGFTKLWPEWSRPMMGGTRPVYGLDRRSLLDGRGRPVLDALVLPHAEHLTTLRRQCPEAERTAVVAGDPCLDRLVGCAGERERYRAALGVRGGQVLVVVASTWGPHSLLGARRDLLTRLPAELPGDHRVIATAHPAVWSAHGVRQVHQALRDVRAAGVDLVDAGEDWRGLVTAADVVVGDHGSVTAYAAAAGIPVLFGHFPDGEVAEGSVMAALAGCGPRVRDGVSLSEQVRAAREAGAEQGRIVRGRVAARLGVSGEAVREVVYRLLGLAEPDEVAGWPAVDVPSLVRD